MQRLSRSGDKLGTQPPVTPCNQSHEKNRTPHAQACVEIDLTSPQQVSRWWANGPLTYTAVQLYTVVMDALHLRQQTPEIDARVDWAMEVAGLTGQAEALPTDLPHGQRKLVGVARALAAQPKLVLLDEPAAGLDTAESNTLGGHLRGLLDHNITVFLIDHDMGLVLSVCDYIYVMDFGRIIAAGDPAEIRTNPEVRAAYLGEEAGEAQARSAEELRDITSSEDEL